MAKTNTKDAPKKAAKVAPVPPGFNTVSVYMTVLDMAKAITVYEKALGAESKVCMKMPDGSIAHAELVIGSSTIMLGPECAESKSSAPGTLGGSPVGIHLYVDDTDALCKRASGAGFKVLMPPADMPWGDRMAKLSDHEGHMWSIGTHIEEVSPEEMAIRMAKMMEHGHGEDCGHCSE